MLHEMSWRTIDEKPTFSADSHGIGVALSRCDVDDLELQRRSIAPVPDCGFSGGSTQTSEGGHS
jgi:hypothetical protein